MSDSFLGRGWSFPPTFVKGKNGVAMVSEEQDICQSLEILLGTRRGERIMRPNYGCDLKEYLFEPMDTGFSTYLADLIETAILYHERRIELNRVQVTEQPEKGTLLIELDYTIRATNARGNLVFPFYLEEGAP